MEEYTIQIINDHEVLPIFVRANSWIIDRYTDLFVEDRDVKNKLLLEKLWLTEFKAILIYDDNIKSYAKISFKNINDMTVFLIRWG
jgi:hypothetical protein